MALLGAHVSIAGGLFNAISRAESLECESIQVFTQSSRTWQHFPLNQTDVLEFRKALENSKTLKKVVAHNSYLLNLSTENNDLRAKSVGYFIHNLERCEAYGIESLITHPGSHLGAGVKVGIAKTVKSLNEVLKATQGFATKILLENTAGQGGCVGCNFEELREISDGVSEPERIFFCFDTQHAFAAGYDLSTRVGYLQTFEECEKKLSLQRILAFHLNDALKGLGSRVDRHQNIGKGFLGKIPFQCLVNDKRFKNIPMCLETDPGDEMINYKKELKLLKSFRTS